MAYYQDLSYLTAKDGTKIEPGKLIKSSRLSKRTINNLGVKRIIDLRTNNEIKLCPVRLENNINYKHMPYFDMRIAGIEYEKNMLMNLLHNIITMEEAYIEMVTNPKYIDNLSKITKEIINGNDFPVLYHCSQGKDRTGIISFVLLKLLGFDEETIMQDYLLLSGNNKIKSAMAYLFGLIAMQDEEIANKIKGFMLVDSNYLNAAIDAINEEFGNEDNFLYDVLNISFNERDLFKEKVLVKK